MRFAAFLAAVCTLVANSSMAQTPDQTGPGTGLAAGAVTGALVGGPIGAVVGGAIGAIAGGALAPPQAAQVEQYVARRGPPSVSTRGPVAVGEPVPARVPIYSIPSDAGVTTPHRYTVLNEQVVLVDPRTRKVVQVLRAR